MYDYHVEKWEASITYKPGRYIIEEEPEVIVGTLRALECFIRGADDRIKSVVLKPYFTDGMRV
jgi:hypothetical protein